MLENWQSSETANYIIVHPNNDSALHNLEGAVCNCGPVVKVESTEPLDEGYELVKTFRKAMVIHNAYDGRL